MNVRQAHDLTVALTSLEPSGTQCFCEDRIAKDSKTFVVLDDTPLAFEACLDLW
jgi:hypothetical protein